MIWYDFISCQILRLLLHDILIFTSNFDKNTVPFKKLIFLVIHEVEWGHLKWKIVA